LAAAPRGHPPPGPQGPSAGSPRRPQTAALRVRARIPRPRTALAGRGFGCGAGAVFHARQYSPAISARNGNRRSGAAPSSARAESPARGMSPCARRAP
jgi:hypothetical protein